MGVPDPCGVLEEGQVCVMLYKSSKPVGVAGVAGASDTRLAEGPTSRAAGGGGGEGAGLPHYGGSNQAKFAERQRRVEGDVVILRNPILHPGERVGRSAAGRIDECGGVWVGVWVGGHYSAHCFLLWFPFISLGASLPHCCRYLY